MPEGCMAGRAAECAPVGRGRPMRPAALAVSPPCARAGDPSCTASTAGLVDGRFGPALAVDEIPPWRAMPRRRSCVAPGRGGRRISCRCCCRRRRSIACRTRPCECTLPNTPLPPAAPSRARTAAAGGLANTNAVSGGSKLRQSFNCCPGSRRGPRQRVKARGGNAGAWQHAVQGGFEGLEALWRTPYIVTYFGVQGGRVFEGLETGLTGAHERQARSAAGMRGKCARGAPPGTEREIRRQGAGRRGRGIGQRGGRRGGGGSKASRQEEGWAGESGSGGRRGRWGRAEGAPGAHGHRVAPRMRVKWWRRLAVTAFPKRYVY